MKSDDEMRNSGGNHAEWKTYIPFSMHSFQKNILPVCEYSSGDLNQDNVISIADLVILNKLVFGTSVDSNIDYILADLTFDGVIDSFDLVKMRQLLIKQSNNYN